MTFPEFSRPVKLERIGRRPLEQSVTATGEECRAVAGRLHIADVAALSARFELEPAKNGVIAVTGRLTARVTQICIVSHEAFGSDVAAEIRSRFTTDDTLIEEFDMDKIDPFDEWDELELVEDGAIDIGELAVQHLSLALDPYPRKPDAVWREPEPETARALPFAILKGLRSTKDEG